MALKISREELDEYAGLLEEKRKLDQRVSTIEKRIKQIITAAHAQLEAAGKSNATRYGYTISIVDGRATVAWKEAFIEACGADAATALQEAAVAKPKCVITPPASTAE